MIAYRICPKGPVPLSVQSRFCIPGRTEQLHSCNIPESHLEQLGMVVPLPDSVIILTNVLPASKVSCASDRSIYVYLMNTSNIDFELQTGQEIGEFCPLVETLDFSSFECSSVARSFGVQDNSNKKKSVCYQDGFPLQPFLALFQIHICA